jgi:hypothetical protein
MQSVLCSTLLAAGFCILPVTADITPNSPDPLDATPEAETPVEEGTGSRLRCWQYGQLLFEEHGISQQVSDKRAKPVFYTSGNGEDGKLLLINAGTSTCLFEQ